MVLLPMNKKKGWVSCGVYLPTRQSRYVRDVDGKSRKQRAVREDRRASHVTIRQQSGTCCSDASRWIDMNRTRGAVASCTKTERDSSMKRASRSDIQSSSPRCVRSSGVTKDRDELCYRAAREEEMVEEKRRDKGGQDSQRQRREQSRDASTRPMFFCQRIQKARNANDCILHLGTIVDVDCRHIPANKPIGMIRQ